MSSEDRAKRGHLRSGKFWLKKCSFFEKIKIDTLRRSGIFENRQNFYSAWRPRIFRGTMNPRARKLVIFIFIAYSDSSHQDAHAHKIWAPGDHGVKRYSEYKTFFQFFPKFWKNTMKFLRNLPKVPKREKKSWKRKIT